jgi:hypothetical protein
MALSLTCPCRATQAELQQVQQQLHEEREASHAEMAPLGPDVAQLTQEQLLLRMQKGEALLGKSSRVRHVVQVCYESHQQTDVTHMLVMTLIAQGMLWKSAAGQALRRGSMSVCWGNRHNLAARLTATVLASNPRP